MTTRSDTATPNEFLQILHTGTLGKHELRADVTAESGGTDAAPGPHDLFDAALAACKSLTAHWYAKKNGMALERVETQVDRDDSGERAGAYKLKVRTTFHGELSEEDRKRLSIVVAKCPIHRLMTTAEITIETLD